MNTGHVCAATIISSTASTATATKVPPLIMAAVALIGLSAELLGCGEAVMPPIGPLRSMVLSSAAGAPVQLSPSFSSEIYDYAVVCAPGKNTFSLSLATDLDRTVSITAPIPAVISGVQSLTVELVEDQAVVIAASTADGGPTQYWLRCLPHDFPVLSVTAHPDAGRTTPGWYLLGNGVLAAGDSGFAMIVDGNGTPVWYQRSLGGAYNVELVSENTVAFYVPTPGQYQVRHLDSGQTEQINTVGVHTDVHELYRLPSGNSLLLAYPQLAGVDLTGLQTFAGVNTISDCEVQELDPGGNLVWQWRASDHVDPVRESTYPITTMAAGQTNVDVFHCNSIEADSNGDLLISARHMDAVFLVSKATGAIKWKLGGAAYSKDNAQLITIKGAPAAAFFRQHDARFLPTGGISLFDDRTAVAGVARGVEYTIDWVAATARIDREYSGPANSQAMGSFRHSFDGSYLVGWGVPSTGTLAATEFDSAGNALLDLSFDRGDHSYRALKVAVSALDINMLRRSVNAP